MNRISVITRLLEHIQNTYTLLAACTRATRSTLGEPRLARALSKTHVLQVYTTRARRKGHLQFSMNAWHAPVLCGGSVRLSHTPTATPETHLSSIGHWNLRRECIQPRGRASLRRKFLSVSVPGDLAERRCSGVWRTRSDWLHQDTTNPLLPEWSRHTPTTGLPRTASGRMIYFQLCMCHSLPLASEMSLCRSPFFLFHLVMPLLTCPKSQVDRLLAE